ncbi:MAG: hypothetical protein V4684_11485 [Pseudomonadota bacterium]
MAAAPTASIVDMLLGLELTSANADGSNRLSIEGFAVGAGVDGSRQLSIRKVEAASLRFASGLHTLEIAQVALHDVVAQVQVDDGRARLRMLRAATAELSGVKIQGPVGLRGPAAGEPQDGREQRHAWNLGPLATADGTLRAEIVDAHLMFDADVTLPIRLGQIDFGDATVEHVGPDSRMGVSEQGIYVDAPNGRSYLYQFSAAPVAGVEFEKRAALIGPLVSDRGKLQLQQFAQGLLGAGISSGGLGLTQQARALLARTAIAGDVQLSDGKLAASLDSHGAQADLVGRAQGRNAVRMHSKAVGSGVTFAMPSLCAQNALFSADRLRLACQEITGSLGVEFQVDAARMRLDAALEQCVLTGVECVLE